MAVQPERITDASRHAEHTPGPWRIAYDGPSLPIITTESPEWGIVALVRDGGYGGENKPYRDVSEPNARLIASAPDLLAALKEMTEDLEARWDMNDRSTNPGIRHCVEQAKAVIAKAEGRAVA